MFILLLANDENKKQNTLDISYVIMFARAKKNDLIQN
jgi:hypothetical protein